MCSAPVFATVMFNSVSANSSQYPTASASDQPIDALDIVRRKPSDTMMGAPARGIDRDDRDLVRLRAVMQRNGHAVVVRTHIECILVSERNVDRRTGRRALGHRGNPGFAA